MRPILRAKVSAERKRILLTAILLISRCAVTGGAAPLRDAAWQNKFKMEFVRISAGTFEMGASEKERLRAFALVKDAQGITKLERYADEGPVHRVVISRDFYLGRYEVTQAQWTSIMHVTPNTE